MGWRHRYIQSKSVYEICFRARENIPFPCREEINFLVECALSWALRDRPVKICSIVVMGNHIHLLVVVYDPEEFVRFYGELMKRLTDSIKRYLGRKHLRIWESRAMVALIADSNACINRIKYFYLNPSRAHLVRSIDQYPGVSSWNAFKCAAPSAGAVIQKRLPQVYLPEITRSNLNSIMKKEVGENSFILEYHPFAWVEVFDACVHDIDEIRATITREIYEQEKAYQEERQAKRIVLRTLKELIIQPVMFPFTPKKYERKVFVIASDKDLRISLIQKILSLSEYCKRLYKAWKTGIIPHEWPLGMFKPRPPLSASLLP